MRKTAILLSLSILLNSCTLDKVEDKNSDLTPIIESYDEYKDIFTNMFNEMTSKYESQFNKIEIWYSYPYIYIDFNSLYTDSEETFKGKCKLIYDEVINIMDQINFEPVGFFTEEVVVSLDFGIYSGFNNYRGCDEYTLRGRFQFYASRDEIPEFEYRSYSYPISE